MTFFDGDENAPAGIADLPACDQFRFDGRSIVGRINHAGL